MMDKYCLRQLILCKFELETIMNEMDILTVPVFGEPKIKPLIVRNPMAIIPEILSCKKCGKPVYAGYGKYYTCDTCNSLTSFIEWKKCEMVS